MTKNNIYISLQLDRDKQSGGLMLNICFDKSAPNFSSGKTDLVWSPTFEEIDFIVEAFEMISKGKSFARNEIHDDPEQPPPQKEVDMEAENTGSPAEVTTFEPVKSDENPDNYTEGLGKIEKEPEDKIFVQANEDKIDEVLKKRKVNFDEAMIVDDDDKTLIDKVLKKKKK